MEGSAAPLATALTAGPFLFQDVLLGAVLQALHIQ